MDERIPVLDQGYVRLIKWREEADDSDLDVVNGAKVSFLKEASDIGPNEERIIAKLGEGDHTSPSRHAVITFEVKAPMMVARQWYKHVVGSMHREMNDPMFAWNEASRRYVTREPEFYLPSAWRGAPLDRRQGSVGTVDHLVAQHASNFLNNLVNEAIHRYTWALEHGICAEQARGFLPANFQYTTWRWTCSLQACLHFLNLRLDDGAQWEIQQYARAIQDLIRPRFPVTYEAFNKESTCS